MPVVDHMALPEIEMRPGMKGKWIADREQGASTVSLLWNLVEPGAQVPLHYHGYEEIVMVEQGQIWLTIDGEQSHVAPGQTGIIPANKVHAWGNDGPGVARVFFLWPVLEPFAPGKSTYVEGSAPRVH